MSVEPSTTTDLEQDRQSAAAQPASVRTRFLLLWTAAVIATAAALIAHLALRLETVRLGYDVGQARLEQRELIESQRMLAIESATLREPGRVETVARGRLGMDVPEPERVVPVGSGARRGTAGRTR